MAGFHLRPEASKLLATTNTEKHPEKSSISLSFFSYILQCEKKMKKLKKKKKNTRKEFINHNEEQLMLLTKLSHIYCSSIVFAHYKAIWRHNARAYWIQQQQEIHPQLTWPVFVFPADLSICQHGLKAPKQAVCWHTPWEKINSFCKH